MGVDSSTSDHDDMSESTVRSDFYQSLCDSAEFTSELGKMTLAVGRLEATLKSYFIKAGIKTNLKRDTLGLLIAKLMNYDEFKSDEISGLNEIRKQRNYLTHDIYALMSNQIDDSSMISADLLPLTVSAYIDAAKALRNDINKLIEALIDKGQQLL